MGDNEKSPCKAQLSRSISDKLDLISKLKTEHDLKKKTIGSSVDEQIVLAEMEYRLVKEEMALLNLQEQHWESAALWDVIPDMQPQPEGGALCEVLHSYIASLQEKGAVPTLHASQHLCPDNSVLISSQGDRPSIPKVEWAHHSTDLQAGDRLIEVNGRLVVGREASEVSRLLRPLCRLVFVRPLSAHQLLRGAGGRETSNLRHELTSVVSRLNAKMAENAALLDQNRRLNQDCDDFQLQNRKLKLQVLSLQSLLLYLYQGQQQSLPLQQLPPASLFDIVVVADDNARPFTLKDLLAVKTKSIPWLELPDAAAEQTADADER